MAGTIGDGGLQQFPRLMGRASGGGSRRSLGILQGQPPVNQSLGGEANSARGMSDGEWPGSQR